MRSETVPQFFLSFVLGAYLVVLRAYSWKTSGDHVGFWGSKPAWLHVRQLLYPTVLLHWLLFFYFLFLFSSFTLFRLLLPCGCDEQGPHMLIYGAHQRSHISLRCSCSHVSLSAQLTRGCEGCGAVHVLVRGINGTLVCLLAFLF